MPKRSSLAAMAAYRAKWGFSVFSALIYHKGRASGDRPLDPNSSLRLDLSDTQRQAYDKASDACEAQAVGQVTGKTVTSEGDWFDQVDKLQAQRVKRELDGDGRLVELASAMADCMAGKGYQITSKNPTSIVDWGAMLFRREMHELARKEGGDDVPPYNPNMWYAPTHLQPAAAQRFLDREIKTALDDLECGKAFYVAYLPRAEEIVQRTQLEFGMDPD
ncbi:hypothetical protein [Nonomuraea sp. NEAU-A123]|uniref:hypothetical protein n=1 Tax=Nonomuraea sp. NEAU-A123 TaxID=2839649 RepID=UPI001BE4AD9A|nr:hypothetical protein [Nonomuraea sp. NEAU-A123]MBT2234651.1 hypothetical protein [Nonomuraea sp. NEAU-A123]